MFVESAGKVSLSMYKIRRALASFPDPSTQLGTRLGEPRIMEWVALFPGSHTLEHKHLSCAGMGAIHIRIPGEPRNEAKWNGRYLIVHY